MKCDGEIEFERLMKTVESDSKSWNLSDFDTEAIIRYVVDSGIDLPMEALIKIKDKTDKESGKRTTLSARKNRNSLPMSVRSYYVEIKNAEKLSEDETIAILIGQNYTEIQSLMELIDLHNNFIKQLKHRGNSSIQLTSVKSGIKTSVLRKAYSDLRRDTVINRDSIIEAINRRRMAHLGTGGPFKIKDEALISNGYDYFLKHTIDHESAINERELTRQEITKLTHCSWAKFIRVWNKIFDEEVHKDHEDYHFVVDTINDKDKP